MNSLFVRVSALILLITAVFNVSLGAYYHHKSYQQIRGEVDKTNTEVLERIYRQVYQYSNPARLLDFFIAQMIGTLEFDYVRKDTASPELLAELNRLYAMFCGVRDYVPIKECLKNLFEQIAQAVRTEKRAHHREMVLLAEEYMKNNYHRDISMEDVADAVMLSPTYFSKVFAECTGTNYKEYLTSMRVSVASQLLRSEEDIQEIAKKSGFTNLSTFYRVFKKYTGTTPKEYRDSLA
ncbi:AraC family transcriptional regulator [Ruminococcaceae bacterium OttesenSCG-928-L11]|nr:AraC family transcriptional regulator [Ruminococcaceae bacterium OttesenSCG-928-L11]